MDSVAKLVANVSQWTSDSSFSPSQRTFHSSRNRISILNAGTLSRMTIWPCSITNGKILLRDTKRVSNLVRRWCGRYGGQMALTGRAAHPSVRVKGHFVSAGIRTRARSVGLSQGRQLGLVQWRMGQIPLRDNKTRSPSPKADDHETLFLIMLRLYGIVVLIRKITYNVCRTVRSVH